MAMSLMIFGAFGATIIALDPSRRTIGWIIPVSVILATVALSTSSTGYIGLVVLCCLLAKRRPMFTLAMFGLMLLGGIYLTSIPAAREAFYNMTLGKVDQGTYVERSSTFAPAIELFAKQPWFGFGWGADFSYSIVTLLLANLGIVGSATFLVAIAGTLLASRAARRMATSRGSHVASYAEAAENALLVYLAESVVSGFKFVVADFWCLWAFAIAIPSCLVCQIEETPPLRSGVGAVVMTPKAS
jgi:O-antigen ligase